MNAHHDRISGVAWNDPAFVRIGRPRLERRLAETTSNAVAVVLGRAGMGKSELLRPYRDDSGVLYFRAGNHHATFARFVRGIARAVARVAPGARESFPRAWERALQSRSPATVLAHWLSEHLEGCAHRLIIDDLHTSAVDANIAAFIAGLVDRRINGGLTLTMRDAGALPLALWMATGRLDRPIGEDELFFDAEERAAACALYDVPEAAIRSDGNPVAFMYALARYHAASDRCEKWPDRGSFDDLARAITDRRSGDQRALLFVAALLPALDTALLAAAGSSRSALYAAFGNDAPFVLESEAAGELRFFDRYADHLAREFAACDDAYREGVARLAVDALASVDRYGDALSVATRQRLHDVACTLLDQHGFAVLEAGDVDTIGEALVTIADPDRQLTARSMALHGYIDARSGRLDTSEAWFRLALEQPNDDASRVAIAMVYAHELALRRRADASDALAPFADATTLPPHVLSDVRSSYAQALTAADRLEEARTRTDDVIASLDAQAPIALRARVYGRAAYVALECGMHAVARERAAIAAPLALEAALYDVAASAYSVLYNIAYEIDDDARAALEYLHRLRDVAFKSGTLKLGLYAQIGIYHLYADTGDEPALLRLDREIAAVDKHDATSEMLEALVPARALQAAWHGRFDDAARLLRPTVEFQPSAERRALCWATIALYEAAAAAPAAASAAARAAALALGAGEPRTTHFLRAQLTLALAAWVAGSQTEFALWIDAAAHHPSGSTARLDALRGTLHALPHITDASGSAFVDLADSLERLRACGYGGMARLIEALPNRSQAEGATVGAYLATIEFPRRFASAVAAADGGKLRDWLENVPATLLCDVSVGERFNRWARTQASTTRDADAIRIVADQLGDYRPPAPSVLRLVDDIDTAIEELFALLDAGAPLMAEHSRAVSAWCSRIARAFGLSATASEFVTRGGLIHDIGKVRTPAAILNAARSLSDEEWAVMRDHAAAGGAMIAEHALLRPYVPIVRGHHERLDGRGYPDGLRGSAIPLAARIVAVADSFNAMIGRRPYRAPMAPTQALAELDRHRGTQFDPEVVDAMQRIVLGRLIGE